MALLLNTITFNHDPLSPGTSALNIRRNKLEEVVVPEYDRNNPRPQAASCAAYSLTETRNQNVVVRVTFETTTPGATYEVRATGGGILRRLDPFVVSFPGATVLKPLDIPLTHRWFSVVSRHDVTWEWSYRIAGDTAWQPLATTSHRIYLVLAAPSPPWVQDAGSPRLPWTDLLDHACFMAQGVADDVNVVRAVTRSINRDYGLRYDIVRSGTANYEFGRTGSQFNLTNWIEFVLKGNPPVGASICDPDSGAWPTYKVVSCQDCAAAVALTAAVLGVGAGYHWHEPFGYLNYVEPIGRGICNNPFYYPNCVPQPPIVGEDTPRTNVVNHTYVKLRDHNYDATYRLWVDFFAHVIYLIVAYLLFWWPDLAQRYYDMAFGYQIDIPQSDYENHMIDTSTPLEAGSAGGVPVQEVLDFQVQ